ncbi:MAG: hypothetical protein R3A48_25180 [Polyangiales bacterium]
MRATTISLDAPAHLFALSPDGGALAVVHPAALTVIDLASAAVRARGVVGGVVYACAFTPDGASVILGTRTPTVFDLAAGETSKAAFKGPQSAPNAVDFSADGATAYFACGSFMAAHDCALYAFDVATRAPRWARSLADEDGNTDLAILGGRAVVFGELGAARLIDLASGAVHATAQVVPAAPYGESLLRGARVDDGAVVASTLEAQAPVLKRIDLRDKEMHVRWGAPLLSPDAEKPDAAVAGRPFVAGARAYVPVLVSAGGAVRVELVGVELETGAVCARIPLAGCQSHLAVLCAGDTLVWSSGERALSIGSLAG